MVISPVLECILGVNSLDFREKVFIPHLAVVLWPISPGTWKAAGFAWCPEENTLQQVQAAMQAALPPGLSGPADPVVLE